MGNVRRRIVITAVAAALSTAVGGSVIAGTQSADESALAPTRVAASRASSPGSTPCSGR